MKAVADAPDAYYIVAETGLDPETRALKDGETFGVFDVFGDIGNGAGQGLFHNGTRHLSRCQLRLTGHRPFLLGSSTGAGGHVLTVQLTNPDLPGDHELLWPKAVMHIRRSSFLWDGTWFTRISVVNHGLTPLSLALEQLFDADFRDVFEVRGAHRPRRGRVMPTRETSDGLVFEYHGLDGVTRQTVIQIEPAPIVAQAQCRVDLTVQPGQRRDVYAVVGCSRPPHAEPLAERFDEALAQATTAIDRVRSRLAGVRTSSDLFDEWLERSRSDIAMMVTQTPHGPYPYAGIPWFSAMFGRDGIITALSVLWADPSLARGVLLSLAATQATRVDPASDAQPGKILHEARGGEMAALGEIPFAA